MPPFSRGQPYFPLVRCQSAKQPDSSFLRLLLLLMCPLVRHQEWGVSFALLMCPLVRKGEGLRRRRTGGGCSGCVSGIVVAVASRAVAIGFRFRREFNFIAKLQDQTVDGLFIAARHVAANYMASNVKDK